MFKSFIVTFAFILLGIPIIFIGVPVIFLAWIAAPSGKYAHGLARRYLTWLSLALGIRVTVTGTENIDRTQPYLIMANHKSAADILVLARVLPLHFKFFAASYLFAFPLFGWGMSMAGYLPINRSNRQQSRAAILKGTEILKQGRASLLIFPEGTRTEAPVIRDFKHGFLRIVSEAQKPILPVVLHGTADIKRKKSLWFHPGHVRVSILPPESLPGLIRDSWKREKEKFQEMFRREYARLRGLS